MAEYQVPEMLRTPLEELVLQIKILKLGMAYEFLSKAIEPPSTSAVNNAINCLKDLVRRTKANSVLLNNVHQCSVECSLTYKS